MIRNPFLISGYISPEFFCDREEETAKMLTAVRNGSNLTLMSPRRMGKTGLIRHAFYKAAKEKDFIPVYVDILATASLKEFTETFGKAVLTSLGKTEAKMKKILRSLSALRLKLTFDRLTGEPALSFEVHNTREAEQSLDSVFRYMGERSERIVIAIDEFQQVTTYEKKNVEALLRTYLQGINNVSLVFSGSRRHVLNEMFSSPGRPLYNLTEMMEIGPIDKVRYADFIRERFVKGKHNISEEALSRIMEITGLHTYYVQYFCNRLYGDYRHIDVVQADNTLPSILKENETVYANYLNLITATQFRVLKAVALNEGVEYPTSGKFLSAYDLGAASTVSQAVKSLEDKEFIFKSGNSYRLNDVFLAKWIQYKSE
ncbi:MAG TPA: ATP-binding protein [Bacteroidales bacterium]|nr:ATP-binding protein [Bacteroidales bacterium]